MKKINILCIFFVCLGTLSFGQTKTNKPKEKKSAYDAGLAKICGADERGMKKYVIAFLKAGPNRTQDSATAAKIQSGHMANIGRMADAGQLVLAGPFMEKGDLKGIYIFNVETVEEAKALTETDPAIQAGRLIMELHPWYGSAGLMQLNEIHKKIQKKDF